MNNPSHINDTGPIPKKKEFRKALGAGPYGPRIFINAGVALLPGVEEVLNKLSTWGGNTSNSPERYSMWEFNSDGFTYIAAVSFLLTSGFREEET